ncbi:RHS repeat-associated core domain-containing protein [Polaribacter sp. Hel_I_88]|uniref:RHS repeat-associated core domain-containing protein n=1 Tax=Polaribacter sp. Hel_I_88 TaxID=1250006 RepID=UPI00047D7CF7|nr:RHS repeat-associated core domain-containing protein [Polaribacter sp. Hel_I_88]
MKKIIPFLLFFLVLNSFSQTLDKVFLTNEVFRVIYGNGADPDDYPAAHYPAVYNELQANGGFEKKAKLLIYLEFKDNVPVFRRDLSSFNIKSVPFRTSVIKVLLEAFKVPLNTNGSLHYNDVDSNTLYYEHLLTAYNLGMLPNSSSLNPENGISYNEFLEYVKFLESSSSVDAPTQSELKDEENYFRPGIYSPETLGQFRGIEQGVFSHYAKNSFAIPDRKMNLNFSHFYSTSMVEIPEGYYPIKPLGRGWSHSYNSYIVRENNVGNEKIDYYNIVWPDGTIHIYNKDDNKYVTLGVYDEFDDNSSTIYITKKNQVRYKYEKLDSDRLIFYLTEIQDSNGNEITIDYENAEEDDTKRIEYVESPSGKKLRFEYASNTDYIKDITDPIGREIRFDLDDDDDNRLENFYDAKGNRTRYSYIENDAEAPLSEQINRFLLDEIKLPKGNEIKATYNSDNAKLSSYRINNDDEIDIDVKFDYESNEFTSKVKIPTAGGKTLTQNYTFNANGLVTVYDSDIDNITIEYPTSGKNILLPNNTNTNGIDVEYDYDSNGNVTKIDKENGGVVEEFEYDSDNNLTKYIDPNENVTQFFYDSDENLLQVIDAIGNSIHYSYDTYGQLTSIVNQENIEVKYKYEDDGVVSSITAPKGIQSTFSYDGINRLLKRVDNGLVSQYKYDENDNLTSFTNSGNFTTSYSYDTNDNLTSIVNAKNVATSFTYDEQDRVIEETFGSHTKHYEYSDEGFLTEFIKPSGTDIDYKYDNDGRLEETGTITDIDYNNRNLLEDVSNASGKVSFRYDNLNLVERVTTTHGYRIEYDYEDTGSLDDIEYPTINGVELETHYLYDDKNRVTKIELLRNIGQDNLILAEYKYLKDDRIAHIDLANNFRIDYRYDEAGRRDYVSHVDLNSGNPIYEGKFILDVHGNITKASESLPFAAVDSNSSSSSNNSYSYNQNNHITQGSGIPISVNEDGNTTSIDSGISLNYDIDDRLISYSDIDNDFEFKYNGFGQRIEMSKDGVNTKFIRDVLQDNILVELDQNNNPIYYYIYSPTGMLIARMKPNGDLQYYHGDIRGSTIAITNESREVTHKYFYDDFGEITKIVEPDNDSNRFRYVGTYGVEYDTEDLFYMRARYYKPTIGRFLTEDPVWSNNLYPYADNNPISRIDPKGTKSFPALFKEEKYKDSNGNTISSIEAFRIQHSGKVESEIIYGESRIPIIGYKHPNDTDKNYRFVQLKNGKQVDMIHFFVVGRRGHLLGFAKEIQQFVMGSKSAFNPQDVYSNELGIQFFKSFDDLLKDNPDKISEYISIYFNQFN